MQYNFDQNLSRRASESVKWHVYPEDVLPLWVADMDFISPQPVIEALQLRAAHGVFGYPAELALLRETVLTWVLERYHWRVQAEDLVFVPGVVTGFNLASHALAQPNGEVLIQTPIYPPMLQSAQVAGMKLHTMSLTQSDDGSYILDNDLFENSLNQYTRMFLLCNPHNPTGRVFQRFELEAMAQACLRQNVIICSDEIHCDLVYQGNQHLPIASLDKEIAQHSITLIAPSKTFNIAGLEFSIAIIPNAELRSQYVNAKQGLVGFPNLMGGVAAVAAYTQGLDWLEQVLRYLEANRDYVYNFVKTNFQDVNMIKPQATYLAWLDCRHTAFAEKPAAFFLENARVALNEGKTFGNDAEGFVRLNFGCPRAILNEALTRMHKAIQESAPSHHHL